MSRIHEVVDRLIKFNEDGPLVNHFQSRGHNFAFVAVMLTEEQRKALENFNWIASTVIGSPSKIALFLKIKPFAKQNTSADPVGDFVVPIKNRHVAVGWRRKYDDMSDIDRVAELLEIMSLSYIRAEDVIGHIALNDNDLDYEEAMRKIEIPQEVLADDKNHLYKLRLGDGEGTSPGDGYGFKKLKTSAWK
ncbi:MAG: hypothetical protein FWC76_05335 [Defluviitaleaceae bacterium]|nr:hypothetical protein [Defluviitaleaceae bacterium]